MLNAIKAYDDLTEYQFTTYLSKHLKNIFFKVDRNALYRLAKQAG